MTKIVLCCVAGATSCLFIQKMKQYSGELGESVEIKALSTTEIECYSMEDANVIVLTPYVRYQKENFLFKTKKPIMLLDIRDYGLMNVKKILPEILALVNQ